LNESDITDLVRADKSVLWHPFTPMSLYGLEEPLIVERGEGAWLIDVHGRRYLDGISSLWVNLHGHHRREIDRAIVEQLEKVEHSTLLGISHPPAIVLAEKLVEIAPTGLNHVFFSDNGSTAVEIALKLAFHYWKIKGEEGRNKFVSLENAYHGDTIGAVSVGGIETFHSTYRPLLFPGFKVRSPYCYRCSLELTPDKCNIKCLDELEELLEKQGETIAAMIVEPLIQAAGGMITAPKGHLKRIRELTGKHGILLIADEVAVGFGRTGTMFACEQEGVSPDLMAVAKGITGGYLPLAATLTSDEVYSAFLDGNTTFYHGHSYTGNPLACAAALANLEIFRTDNTLKRVNELTARLWKNLERFRDHPHVGDVRGRGLIAGIELVKDKQSKTPYPVEHRVGHRVTLAARRRGLVTRPLGNVLVVMPPYVISDEELDFLVDVLYDSMDEVTANYGDGAG